MARPDRKISRKGNGRVVRSNRGKWVFVGVAVLCCCALALVGGCSVTYPKERLKESLVKICKDEYDIDVKVDTIGGTIAIYLPLGDLMDSSFSLTKEASEKINDVILSVARVALSTDAKYNFYCIIAHDTRVPEIQIVIIKSVDDVKRLLLNDISRGEYSKRMLIDLRLNPQSQKERSVKDVFQKMGLDDKWQEQVMNDFFRSEPAMLGDIGYWDNRFYIKDITLPEFMAEQMASRVKIEFKEDKVLADSFSLRSAKGSYFAAPDKRYFEIEILADPRSFKEAGESATTDKVFRAILPIIGHVVHIYKFDDFDFAQLINQSDGRTIVVTKDALEKLRTKKITYEDLVE